MYRNSEMITNAIDIIFIKYEIWKSESIWHY